ncbi:unnamed protein product [Amoebophrya sp. A25]|nr:unnamed protein product [Amoebophrya sp. A25]|eukprot:GSA25T00015174001.1
MMSKIKNVLLGVAKRRIIPSHAVSAQQQHLRGVSAAAACAGHPPGRAMQSNGHETSAKAFGRENPGGGSGTDHVPPTFSHFVNGSFQLNPSGTVDSSLHQQVDYRDVISPVTNVAVSQFPCANDADVAAAVSVAQRAFDDRKGWAGNRAKRVQALQKMAAALRDPETMSELAASEVQQIGRPLREMRFQLGRLHEWFDYYAALLRVHEDAVLPLPESSNLLNYTRRVPLGVVAQITPWNHPLLITVKKLAPALAAGNAIVVKPSELAPNSIVLLAEILTKACNADSELLPPGILNVVLGDGRTGAALVGDSRIAKVDFTGGPSTGRAIGRAAGGNLAGYIAELGGKSPMVLFDDGQRGERIQQLVNGVTFGCFIASGQTCIAGTRLLVQKSLVEKSDFLDRLVEKVNGLKVGDPLASGTGLGPVITKTQLDFIESTVQAAVKSGAKVLCGGARKTDFPADSPLRDGNFFEPSVLLCDSHDNIVFHTELFGPVLAVTMFGTEEEAVALANGTEFGLGCSVWSSDVAQAHRVAEQIDSGIVWINEHHKNDPSAPWGGVKKASGIGRENGRDAFNEYTQSKSIVVNCAPGGAYTQDWFGNLNARYN